MKIIVTGSLGHISQPLTKELVEKGHSVTVISSNSKKQKDIEALGAVAAIGTLEDVDFLAKTFAGADAVYTMIPPSNFFDHTFDFHAFYNKVAGNYAEALEKAGVKKVVHLSSIGAHLEKDSGIILGHHQGETILSKLSNVDITFMRPTSFYYNLYSFINVIKSTGKIMSNYGGDDKYLGSPIDIAAATAEELEASEANTKVRYVASEELTCNEVAGIIGAAIGKPDLQWITISNEEMEGALNAIGMNPQFVAGLVEMNASIHNGKLSEDYYLHQPALGKVKLSEFAKEFAAAYHS